MVSNKKLVVSIKHLLYIFMRERKIDMAKKNTNAKVVESVVVEFEFYGTTKRCFRYSEVAEEGEEKIGSLYIKQTTAKELGLEEGDSIKVTLSK